MRIIIIYFELVPVPGLPEESLVIWTSSTIWTSVELPGEVDESLEGDSSRGEHGSVVEDRLLADGRIGASIEAEPDGTFPLGIKDGAPADSLDRSRHALRLSNATLDSSLVKSRLM